MRRRIRSFVDGVRGDQRIYAEEGLWFEYLGFWAAATHRCGSFGDQLESPVFRLPALLCYKIAQAPWRVVLGVHLPASTRIGPGLRIPHAQNILVAPGAKLGQDCSIYNDVTIGRGPIPGVPTLGDRVMVYPGARVLGGITIGDDAVIGANAVVTKDVPPGATVMAPPSRVIPAGTIAPPGRPPMRVVGAARDRRAG